MKTYLWFLTVVMCIVITGRVMAASPCDLYGAETISQNCGDLTYEGCCTGEGALIWCESGYVCLLPCQNYSSTCGWNTGAGFYDCGYVGEDPSGQHPIGCPGCTPDCADKECGSDGCGGECGTCDPGAMCIDGRCCVPDCTEKECGSDGCGGVCGYCSEGYYCDEAQKCTACSCDGLECGFDPCGNPCGTCPAGQACDMRTGSCVSDVPLECIERGEPGCPGCGCEACVCAMDPYCCEVEWDYICVTECHSYCGGPSCNYCFPACEGKECGPDGCGGECGTCDPGAMCIDGRCCLPDCTEKECGSDGCGGVCGYCSEGYYCDEAQKCTACSCDGLECGFDPCGNPCGTCPAGQACDMRTGSCVSDVPLECIERGEPGCPGCGCEACVCAMDPYCCEVEWDYICVTECHSYCGGPSCNYCFPACEGKECGPDGCGGECGVCGQEGFCDAAGKCNLPYPETCLGIGSPSADNCMPGLTYEGCCDGSGRVVWCENGKLYCIDCAGSGQSCGWKELSGFYDCDGQGADPSGTFPLECVAPCVPNCNDKECGDDGCGGQCAPGCDDSNPCTDDICDFNTGKCTYINNEAPCDDSNACTRIDVCKDGVCMGNDPVVCEAKDQCHEVGVCDPVSGLCSDPVKLDGTECDADSNGCTIGDRCIDGECEAGLPPDCSDLDDQCNIGVCLATGIHSYECVKDPVQREGFPCSDGSACTKDDICIKGICEGTAVTCDDANPCTDDSCDHLVGCVFTENNNSCDDGNACTIDDICMGGKCIAGTELICDDVNPCTDDMCDPATGCIFIPNSAKCDDQDPCTKDDICNAGICSGTSYSCPLPAQCEVAVWCDGKGGCLKELHEAGVQCDDKDPCTYPDECDGFGNCIGTPQPCVPGVCHASVMCDGLGGCVFEMKEEGAECDDGDPCTKDDQCDGKGSCIGEPYECPKPGPCELSIECSGDGGCIREVRQEGTPCDDGDPCTKDDQCDDRGTCIGTPISPCMPDAVEVGPEELLPEAVEPAPEGTDITEAAQPDTAGELPTPDDALIEDDSMVETLMTETVAEETYNREDSGGCQAADARPSAAGIVLMMLSFAATLWAVRRRISQ